MTLMSIGHGHFTIHLTLVLGLPTCFSSLFTVLAPLVLQSCMSYSILCPLCIY